VKVDDETTVTLDDGTWVQVRFDDSGTITGVVVRPPGWTPDVRPHTCKLVDLGVFEWPDAATFIRVGALLERLRAKRDPRTCCIEHGLQPLVKRRRKKTDAAPTYVCHACEQARLAGKSVEMLKDESEE
jgi:hypothetical protein